MGIDSSAYTTSLALVSEDRSITAEERIVLAVPEGARGLRQSEAVYQHLKNMPVLFKRIESELGSHRIAGIAVSTRPENREESFMPVFNAGISFAETVSSVTGAPLMRTAHQENHLEAAAFSSGETLPERFLGVHFSGGTSEILDVTRTARGYNCSRLAQSLDLKAGQLIDRTGVLMGLGFPAGKDLEKLALSAENGSARSCGTGDGVVIPVAMDGADFHFSGQENKITRLLQDGARQDETALALFRMIARTLNRSLRLLTGQTGLKTVLFSGGVMANGIIHRELQDKLAPAGIHLVFSDPRYSSDNACGNALLAQRFFAERKTNAGTVTECFTG
ncbi:MAG: peptidase M22 [Eubacteriaceae bacterium]